MMLDYSLAHWLTFLTAAILLNLSPGPDMVYIVSQTVRGGRRAGLASMLGIWTGACGHVALAVAGVSAIIATSAVAFSIVKWLGAAYLIWLGLCAFLSRVDSPVEGGYSRPGPDIAVYRQGITISLLNPKVALFFLAFLPQFVVEGAGPVWLQLLLHGGLIIVVAAFIELPLIFISGALTARLRADRRLGIWLNRGLGAIFIGLGIRLALEQR